MKKTASYPHMLGDYLVIRIIMDGNGCVQVTWFRLCMVGPSNVVPGFDKKKPESGKKETMVLADTETEITGWRKIARKFNLLIEKEGFSAAAEAVKTALNNILIKKPVLCRNNRIQEERQK